MINVLYSILVIALCLITGKVIDAVIGGLPGSLYGMLIFTTLLHYRVIKSERISTTIAWLIQHMGVCFVPAGVGIINHFELIKTHGITLISIIFVTTFLIITAVGLLYQRTLDKRQISDGLTNKVPTTKGLTNKGQTHD
jgi:holin-like protein